MAKTKQTKATKPVPAPATEARPPNPATCGPRGSSEGCGIDPVQLGMQADTSEATARPCLSAFEGVTAARWARP
jgi:hypothetical protein